eukprot:TRINITY_DN580_c3_g1_i3.p1 TRINITY_DN580_c3_g1~~TRINITY_DN580_c3_g1_i3.p1  ORF type:complete len:270 (+),score=72.66 TRINITY_DN580_c3_g1_i3:106-915(+)
MRFPTIVLCVVGMFCGAAAGDVKAQAVHILMKDEEELKKVQKEIQEGADFGKMAEKHSTCPSGKKGGDLGKFGRGSMVKEFDEVVFSEETIVGEVYGPVKTQFGHHLIKVVERDGAGGVKKTERKKKKSKKTKPVEISSLEQFTKEVIESKEVFAVEFYSKMCGSCKEFSPTWTAYSSSSPPVKTATLSIDDSWVMTLATEIGVMEEGIPSVRLFSGSSTSGIPVVSGSTPDLKTLQTDVLASIAKEGIKKKGKKSGIYRKTGAKSEEL